MSPSWWREGSLPLVQTRNQKYYNRKARERQLNVEDSVLLLLPTENKLTIAWRRSYKVVGVVGDVDYRIQISPDKVKTYHINMLKQYFLQEFHMDVVVTWGCRWFRLLQST